MPKCHGCGSFVTEDFARVLGNNDGVVKSCPDCGKKHGGEYSKDGGRGNKSRAGTERGEVTWDRFETTTR